MAVYTQVSDADIEDFLKYYNIGTLQKLTGIPQGVENTNYFLDTTTGRYILTLFEKRVNPLDLPYFLGFSEHLSVQNIPCPHPIRDKQGEIIRKLLGKSATIISFLKGSWKADPSVTECAKAGAFFANLHRRQAGFALNRPNSLSLAGWKELYVKIKSELHIIDTHLSDYIAEELNYLEKNFPHHLPIGHIHADLFPDNVFFDDNNISGVIDFYFSCTDILAYDLAICVNAWCFDRDFQFNSAKAEALLKEYQEIRPLSVEEKASLQCLARGASLRFLLTRSHDWIFHDKNALVSPKNPLEYFEILQYHRDNDIAQYL